MAVSPSDVARRITPPPARTSDPDVDPRDLFVTAMAARWEGNNALVAQCSAQIGPKWGARLSSALWMGCPRPGMGLDDEALLTMAHGAGRWAGSVEVHDSDLGFANLMISTLPAPLTAAAIEGYFLYVETAAHHEDEHVERLIRKAAEEVERARFQAELDAMPPEERHASARAKAQQQALEQRKQSLALIDAYIDSRIELARTSSFLVPEEEMDRRARCRRADKVAYPNDPDGLAAARRHRKAVRRSPGVRVDVYECTCGWLHVGRQRTDDRKRLPGS